MRVRVNVKTNTGRWGVVRFLGVGVVFVAVLYFWSAWMRADQGLPRGDAHRYLAAADRARAILARPDLGVLQKIRELGQVHPTHPPLFPVVCGALMPVTGFSVSRMMVVQLGFLLLLLVSVYNTGRILTHRRRGLAAVILVASLPLAFKYSHTFFLEMAATAFVAWAMWLLIAWRAYGGWGRALLLGVVIGLGLLTKWTTIVFILVPGLVLLDRLRRHRDFDAVEVWVAFLLGLLIALPWYATHFSQLVDFVAWNRATGYWHLADLTTLAGWFFYLEKLPLMMGGLPFLLAVIGTIWALFRPRREGMLLAWLVFPLIVFTVISTKAFDGRHLLPALPAAALLGALAVTAPWRGARVAAWIVVVAAFPLNLIPSAGLGLKNTVPPLVPGTAYSVVGYFQEPDANDSGARGVYDGLRGAMDQARQDTARALVLAARGSLNADGINYLDRLERGGIEAFTLEPQAAGESQSAPGMPWRRALDADYWVFKLGLPVDSNLRGYHDELLAWSDFFLDRGVFDGSGSMAMVASTATPDGDEVRIYEKRSAFPPAFHELAIRSFLGRRLGRDPSGLEPEPSVAMALEELAMLREKAGDTRTAQAIRDALRIAREDPAHAAEHLPARAVAVPGEPWLTWIAARALFEKKQYDDAVRLLEKRSSGTSLEPALLRLLGAIRLAQGRFASAAEAAGKEARLDRRDPDVYQRLARALEKAGHPDAAARAQEIGLLKARVAEAPGDRWVDLLALGRRLRSTDPEEAADCFYRAVLAAPADDPAGIEAFQAWMTILKGRQRAEEVVDFLERRRSRENDEGRKESIDEMIRELTK